jgi:acyl-CoA thioesterase FadM
VAVVDRGADGVDASWPRVSASCDYLSAVRFGDELEVSVSVEAVGRTSVTYAFAFAHDGRSVARGRVVAVRCLMRPGAKPEAVAIPTDIVRCLDAHRSTG